MEKIHEYMKPGKLPHQFLDRLLQKYTRADNRVVTGATIGEDATIIDFGENYLIAKTDPITFVTDFIGYYVIHINANDIYCMGGRPKWFLATILLPEENTSTQLVENIFAQIAETCDREDVVYCGGHTEVTIGLDRPIVIGQMLGEVKREHLLRKQDIRDGDKILLANGIPIEGTAIIALEKGEQLKKWYNDEFIKKCREILFDPGISIRRAALAAQEAGGVRAMHDPTEGGLATALYELSQAAGIPVTVFQDKIPILEEGRLLCERYGIDPLGLISSGALLVVADADKADNILRTLSAQGILTAEIGEFCSENAKNILIRNGKKEELKVFSQDEIVKIFVDE